MKLWARLLGTIAIAGMLSVARPSRGADNAPLLQAIFGFADALEAADAEKLRQSIWIEKGQESQRQGRDAWVALAVAQKRLEKTAESHFAAEGERFRCGFGLFFTEAARKTMASAPADLEESGAKRVYKEDEVWPLRLRQSPEGQWQVLLDVVTQLDDERDPISRLSRPDGLSQPRINRMRAMADAFAQVADRIDRGELASALAADSELTDRLMKIENDHRGRGATEQSRTQSPW